MKVVVRPYLFLREALKVKEIIIDLPEEAKVRELLQTLCRDHGMPEKLSTAKGYLTLINGKELAGMIVLINGRNIKELQGLDTILDHGVTISLFPPVAGG